VNKILIHAMGSVSLLLPGFQGRTLEASSLTQVSTRQFLFGSHHWHQVRMQKLQPT